MADVQDLVEECARRSSVVWVAAPGQDDRLVWHAWHDGAVVVLTGPDQAVPGLAAADRARLTLRSRDSGGRLVATEVGVEPVPADDPRHGDHLDALVAARLNLRDPVATRADWSARHHVLRLLPRLP